MSVLQTRREYGDRVARVHDDILLAAPKHGTMPKWNVRGLLNGADMGTFQAINREGALEQLVRKIHLEGVPIDEAKRVVAGGSFEIIAVEGEVCIRAGKIVAISESKDRPWILDLGNMQLGLTSEWEFVALSAESSAALRRAAENPQLFPLGSWTWLPGRWR